jgi:hypothetical protein
MTTPQQQQQEKHTEALRAFNDVLIAMKNGGDDAEIRAKTNEMQRLLASYVEKLERHSGEQQQTHGDAFRDLVDSYQRWLVVEDSAAALLRGLLPSAQTTTEDATR